MIKIVIREEYKKKEKVKETVNKTLKAADRVLDVVEHVSCGKGKKAARLLKELLAIVAE